MTLRCFENNTIPPLSWCAAISGSEVRVCHGNQVETTPDSFFEGAWSGPFREQGFAEAVTFAGSGGRIMPAGLVIATATHTMAPLYLIRQPGRVLCSNFLALLLVAAQDDLDPEYPYYDRDLMAIMRGVRRYTKSIPTKQGGRVEIYCFTNLLVNSALAVAKRPKTVPKEFASFEEYFGLLCSEVRKVAANAQDLGRHCRYDLMATLSSGYDSAASAVVGRSAGCTHAITAKTARGDYDDTNDSGKPVGDCLGMTVHEFEPEDYRNRSDMPEPIFIGAGFGGDDVIFAGLRDTLRGKVMLTGYPGDKMWELHRSEVSGNDLERGDPGGCSLEPFRLQTGFLHLPVPFIGASRYESVLRLSLSREMEPWRVGRDYDRPVPRRMLEDAGVGRTLFGQSKKAAARPFQGTGQQDPAPESMLAPHSLEDYRAFLRTHAWRPRQIEQLRHRLLHRLYPFLTRVFSSRYIQAAGRLFHVAPPLDAPLPWRFAKPYPENPLLFHWAFQHLCKRYLPEAESIRKAFAGTSSEIDARPSALEANL